MGDRQFKYGFFPDRNGGVFHHLPASFIAISTILLLIALAVILAARQSAPASHASVTDGNVSVPAAQLSTDGALNFQPELSASINSSSSSQPAEGTNQNTASASVTVDGQTFQVNGNGSLDKTIITNDGSTASVNISVQNDTSSTGSTSKTKSSSHSTLQIRSHSEVSP